MTILSKLNFTDKARVPAATAPEARLRGKLIEAMDIQIQAATAEANGEVYIRRAKRWIDDPATGERVLKEIPVRLRPWWWRDVDGKVLLEIRYGNRRLEVQPKKATVDVGDISNLVLSLKLLRDAVTAGELDKVLMAAKDDRSANFRRRSKAA